MLFLRRNKSEVIILLLPWNYKINKYRFVVSKTRVKYFDINDLQIIEDFLQVATFGMFQIVLESHVR
jgi:hypothetical protein